MPYRQLAMTALEVNELERRHDDAAILAKMAAKLAAHAVRDAHPGRSVVLYAVGDSTWGIKGVRESNWKASRHELLTLLDVGLVLPSLRFIEPTPDGGARLAYSLNADDTDFLNEHI